MTHHEVKFTPTAILTFTLEELEVLLECCEKHYDYVCRSLAAKAADTPDGRNGKVRGMLNATTVVGENYSHELTWREIDTMVKSLEVGQYLPDVERGKAAFGLGLELRKVLHTLNDHAMDNKVLTPLPPRHPFVLP